MGVGVFVDILEGFLQDAVEVDLGSAVDGVPIDGIIDIDVDRRLADGALRGDEVVHHQYEVVEDGGFFGAEVVGNLADLLLNTLEFVDIGNTLGDGLFVGLGIEDAEVHAGAKKAAEHAVVQFLGNAFFSRPDGLPQYDPAG